MKKSKILIPALSLAGVGAIVTPMVSLASCGNKVYLSTDKIDFTGDQHTAVTGGWTIAQATEDYFKDEKHLANDILSAAIYVLKYQVLDRYTDEGYYSNFKVDSLHIELQDYSFAEKEAKVEYKTVTNKDTLKGALFSARLVGSVAFSYDDVLTSEEKLEYSKIHNKGELSFNFLIKDCFAFIGKNLIPGVGEYKKHKTYTNNFSLNIFGVEDASKNWKMDENYSRTQTTEYTLKSGKVNSEVDVGGYNALFTCNENKIRPLYPDGYGLESVSYFPSSYLAKVGIKKENIPMSYREDVYYRATQNLGYYANLLLLTPGQEYTFYADIKASDKIDTISVIAGDFTALPIKASPTIKLDGVTQSWTLSGTGTYHTDTPIAKAGRLSITFTIDETYVTAEYPATAKFFKQTA